jgi:hypothetical protein
VKFRVIGYGQATVPPAPVDESFLMLVGNQVVVLEGG